MPISVHYAESTAVLMHILMFLSARCVLYIPESALIISSLWMKPKLSGPFTADNVCLNCCDDLDFLELTQ